MARNLYNRLSYALLAFIMVTMVFGTNAQTKRYWVGGTGAWTDVNKWSLTSGGAGGASVPGLLDTAVFDGSSGAPGFTTTNAVMASVAVLDASAAPNFTLNVDLTVTTGFTGPVSATFGSAGKKLIIDNVLPSFPFSSNGFTFLSDVELDANLGDIQVNSSILGADSLVLVNGAIVFNASNVTANVVNSPVPGGVDSRNFTFNTCSFLVNNNAWEFFGYNVLSDRAHRVEFVGTMNGIFRDNVNITTMVYDSLFVPAITELLIPQQIGIRYLETGSDTLRLGASEGLGYGQIVAPGLSCSNYLFVKSTSATVNAPFRYLGAGTTSTLNFFNFTRIAAQNTPTITYTGSNSIQTNSTGFNLPSGHKFYWIGNGGNWSDPTHWSYTSGGIQSCFFPQNGDSLIFDVNSFNLPNQEVVMNTAFTVGYMDWIGLNPAADTVKFKLDTNLLITGYASFDSKVNTYSLFNTTTFQFPSFEVKGNLDLDLANSFFDVNTILNTVSPSDTLHLISDYTATDSSTFYLQRGNFYTNNFKMNSQAFVSRDFLNVKTVNLGSSTVTLKDGWDTDTIDFYLNVIPGTSNIIVGRGLDTNYFIAKNQNFYDVVFNYNPLKPGKAIGSNTLHHLTITPGSEVVFKPGDTYTLDSLIIDGKCLRLDIDTVKQYLYNTDTLSVVADTFTYYYYDTVSVNNFGFGIISPADTVIDTIYTIEFTNPGFVPLDTVYITSINSLAPLIDTIAGPLYIYELYDTTYTTTITVERTIVDSVYIYNYSVDSSLLTGYGGVYLHTSTLNSVFTFTTPKIQNIYGTTLEDINISTASNAYFSTDSLNTTGWTFQPDVPAQASFTVAQTACLFTPLTYTNTSTSYTTFSDLISIWNMVDTSMINNNSSFSYTHPTPGQKIIELTVYHNHNYCSSTFRDTIQIKDPIVTLGMSEADSIICAGTTVEFTASSPDSLGQFEFYLNSSLIQGPSLVDSIVLSNLVDGDTISVASISAGCTTAIQPNIIFDVKPLPTVNLVSSDANDTICAGDTVVFTASGANKYRFYKNGLPLTTFVTNPVYTIPNLVDGDSIVVIGRNDTTQCVSNSNSHVFQVDTLPIVGISANIPSPICAGTAVTFTATNAGLYEFFVNGVSQGAASASATFTTSSLPNNAVVTVRGINSQGCSKMSPTSLSYTVIPNPVVTLSSDDPDTTICSGTLVNFFGTGASQYEFFLNNVSQGASGSNTLSSATFANNDQVYVVGTLGLCRDTSSVMTLTVLNNPTTNLTSSVPNDTICQNQSVTYTATGAVQYEFFLNGVSIAPPSATSTFTSSTLINGDVISVVGDNAGCLLSDQSTITVNAIPNVNISSSDADNIICSYNTITFTGSGAAQYSLGIDNVFGPAQASPTFTNTFAADTLSINIMGTSANGCTNLSNSTITLIVNPQPTVNMVSNDLDNIICAGTPVTFTGSGSTTYQFYVNGVSQTGNSTINTYTTNALTDGSTIFVRGTQNGCLDTSATLTFTVNAIPSVNLTSSAGTAYCQGAASTFTSSGASAYEFFINGSSQGAPSAVNTLNGGGLTPGSYTIGVTGTTSGCSSNASYNVLVNANPVASLTSSDIDNVICAGDNVVFTGSGGTQYQFLLDGSPIGPYSSSTTYSTASLTNGQAVIVNVRNPAGCVTPSSNIVTTVNPNPTVGLVSDDLDAIICVGTPVVFTGSGANDYEFLVNGVSQGPASPTTTFNTSSLSNGQSISVVGTSLGCSTTSAPIVFTVNNYPTVNSVNPSGTNLCSNVQADVIASGANTYQFLINGVPVGPFSPVNSFNQFVNDGDVLTISGNSAGCISNASTSYTFDVVPTPVVSLACSDVDQIICVGDDVLFTSSGAGTYNYAINGIPVQQGANNLYNTTELIDGDVVTVQGFNVTCPSAVETLTFVVNSMNLELAVNPNIVVCEGDNVQLVGSGADNYEFFVNGSSQGAMSAINTVNYGPVQIGDYFSLTANNTTTGCTQELGYDMYPFVTPNVGFTQTGFTEFCQGDSLILVSDFSYGNQWTLNGTAIPGETDDTLIVTASGDYGLIHTAGGTGQLWSKGYNGSGTFADNTNIDSPLPIEGVLNENLVAVSSGYDFALGLSDLGNVFAWGENGSGQLGNGTFTTTNAAIAVPTLANIQSVATSSSSSMALTNSGQLYVWGNNNYGQLGVGSTAIINFPFLLPSMTNIVQVAGGKDHFLALRNDGTVWAVGRNAQGQLGLGNQTNVSVFTQVAGLSGIVDIGAGENHSFAIDGSNNLYVWGSNVYGQLGLGDNTNRLQPVLSNLKEVTHAEGGANHSVFLTQSKEIYVSGDNSFGQLGLGTNPGVVFPEKVAIGGIDQISVSEYATLLLKVDNHVWGTGYNQEQQLDASFVDQTNFIELPNLIGVSFVESGKRTTHAIFGESASCSSTDVAVTVNIPTTPVITENNNLLTSTAASTYQWYHNGIAIPSGTAQSYQAFATGYYYVETTDANGCSASSDSVYLLIASVSEQETVTLTIYPNPTQGQLNIQLSNVFEDMSVVVMDLTGRIVSHQNNITEPVLSLDLSENAEGTYFVRVMKQQKTLVTTPVVLVK